MNRLFTLAVILVTSSLSHAQAWIGTGYGSEAINANNSIMALTTDSAGKVYAAGLFTDSLYPAGHAYVAVWNGLNWQMLGTDTNALRANNAIYTLTTDIHGNVYAAGAFTDHNRRTFVSKWNGNHWQAIGTDTSGLNAVGSINAIKTDTTGRIFATGSFTDFVFTGHHQYYVAVWDSHWHELGEDSNIALRANAPINAMEIDARSNIYVGGSFTDSLGYYYVAKWDGQAWRSVGSGTHSLRASAPIRSIVADKNGNVYAAGDFRDSANHCYIAKWNGTYWSKLQSTNDSVTLLGYIHALTIDSAGDIFAAGQIADTSGNFSIVVKWNGSYLAEAAHIRANDRIFALTADGHNNVFAAGNFNDANRMEYVAEYTTRIEILPSGIEQASFDHIRLYPNPVRDLLNIESDNRVSLELYDITGRRLLADSIMHSGKIEMSDFAAGMYILTIRSDKDIATSRRIIKQ